MTKLTVVSMILLISCAIVSGFYDRSFKTTIHGLFPRVSVAVYSRKPHVVPEFTTWTNPKLTPDEAFQHWKEHDFLMTIGSQGVAATHANSLQEMLRHHPFVKIKLATDKLDAHKVSAQLLELMAESKGVEVVEIRRRGVLFSSRPLPGV